MAAKGDKMGEGGEAGKGGLLGVVGECDSDCSVAFLSRLVHSYCHSPTTFFTVARGWVACKRWLDAEPAASPPPGDRKGSPRVHPAALAPTESGHIPTPYYGKVSLHAPRPCVAA